MKTLNQSERHPMPVEEQVAQIYAATNGYLDRIVVSKVEEFLSGLAEYVRGNEPELMKKIAGRRLERRDPVGAREGVSQYSEDFGYDLDEEGHPLRRKRPSRPNRPMATSQRDVRNRIAAVKNIQKITRAMEMVAAARLRRAEQRIEALRPYADAIRRMTRQAAEAAGDVPRLPILTEHERSTKVGLLVVAGDRGLAGRVQLQHRSAPAWSQGANTPARGGLGAVLRLGPAPGVVAGVPRARRRRELHRLHRPARVSPTHDGSPTA